MEQGFKDNSINNTGAVMNEGLDHGMILYVDHLSLHTFTFSYGYVCISYVCLYLFA